MIRFIKFSAISVFILVLTLPVFSQINVKPAIIEETLERGKLSGSFEIRNVTDKEVRLRAMPGHFELDRQGSIQTVPISVESLANWLKLNPREFTLSPLATRQVRYALITPDSLEAGSYWCSVQFQALPSAEDSARARETFVPIAGVLVPLLADKGDISYDWEIDSESITQEPTPEGVAVHVPLRNLCRGRIPYTGTYELRDTNGEIVNSGTVSRVSVFPNSIRYISVMLPADLPSGDYDFSLTIESEATDKTLNGQIQIQIP